MKTQFRHVLMALALLALSTFNHQLSIADAQGTAFTYQGRLNNGANPANGSYDLTFTLFATNTSGVAIAGPVTNSATAVSNGLFTVMIDFGASAFTGGSNWMEIAVRTNGSSSFITLAPRQQVTPAPYAILAENANSLPGLAVQQNASGAPNVVGGASDNFVSGGVVGATIAGGGATNFAVSGRGGTTYFSYTNSVTANFGTVSGGSRNTASGQHATVGGGDENTASGLAATVGGGTLNTASGQDATVGGGDENTASGNYSTTSGGFANQAKSLDATVAGGAGNVASNQFATVSGGDQNIAGGLYAAVGGGYHDYAISNYSTVSGGYNNLASGDTATVAGGTNNTASGVASFAAGANARALHDGSFVWADNSGGTFASTVSNQFSVRATGGIRLAGDVQIDNSAYHYLSLDGGNSLGFVYGSFPAFGDGVHFGYNYYADAGGIGHVINSGGATSRISAGYGTISLLTGGINSGPSQGLTVNGGNVNVTTSLGVNIGGVTPIAALDISSDIFYRGNGVWRAGINSSGNFGWVPLTSGADVAYIDTSGNYHQVSDRSLKRDVTSLDHALDRLLQLRPVSYRFRSQTNNAPLSIGFIAQEIQPLFPEVVGDQTNGVKDVVYSELIPVTIRSIQELNQKLETQAKQKDMEIQDLKKSNDVLSKQLNDLQAAVNALREKK